MGKAIAAILVLLYHLGIAISSDKYFGIGGFQTPFSFGNAGVEFFFVLSGFIIYFAHKQDLSQTGKLGIYAVKRFTRIYPTYWLIFLAVCLMAMPFPALRATIPHQFSSLIKALLLIPQDKAIVGGTGAPVLIVAWRFSTRCYFM